jgi:Tetratricopeptide repeat
MTKWLPFRAVVGVVLLSASICGDAGQAKSQLGPAAASSSEAHPKNEYLGSQACSRCHSQIYREFSQTGMGRSMSVVTPATLLTIPSKASYVNQQLSRRFDVYSTQDKLYQSETGIAADGKESFQSAHQIDWIIGAGLNGFGAIIRKDQYLFQAPLSFYSKAQSWGPSPGYESLDIGFNRPIPAGCIFCHSGRPNSVGDNNGKFEPTPFAELAIGCEKCHGPGAAHVQAMQAKSAPAGKKNAPAVPFDSKIVDPSRLTPYLADNICMACHQTGDVRVLKPGKKFQDIRPGHPLDEWLSILMVPPTPQSPPSEDHVEHYYSMTLSKCYRATQGRLSCITCHDPHVEPSREEAPAYFAAKCLTCHTNQSCKLSLEARMQQQPANDCIGCHMPKRNIQVISHSTATNHRIVARPGEPFPDETYNQTTPALPDLVRLNPAQTVGSTSQSDSLPAITLLRAYGELAENRPQYVAAYLRVLSDLEKTQPDDALVQAALGRRDLKNNDYQSAVKHLRLALQSPSPEATTYADLADALVHLGQTEEALPLVEKAVDLDPYNPVVRKMLVIRLIAEKQYTKAHQALEQYLEIFPQDDFMRQMLARAEGKSTGP